jgi:hypothetical protein
MMRRLIAVAVCVGLVSACAPSTPAGGVTATSLDRALFGQPEVLLRGRVLLPSFALKANATDVADNAMVVLSGGGGPLATGLADPQGHFTLYQPSEPAAPFTPGSDQFYKLEVVKRVPVAGGPTLLSLQTVLQWTAERKWRSISGETIIVNLLTTAVTLVQRDDAATDHGRIMGVVSGSDADSVAAFGGHAVIDLRARLAVLHEMLADNQDPGGGDRDYPAAVYTGDVVITDAASLAAAQGYGKIVGNLTVSGAEAAEVELPNLVWVTGNVTDSGSPGRTALRLPKLRRVDGAVTVSNATSLTALGLSKLTVVKQGLELSGLSVLGSLALAKLEMVGGTLAIRQNAQLPMCQATAVKDRVGATTADLTGNLGTCP